MSGDPERHTRIIACGLSVAALALATSCRDGGEDDEDHSHHAALHAHPHDASQMLEHRALLRLLEGDELATHVATADGAWFDAATWSSGSIPGRGAIVRVPEGITVSYEGAGTEPLFLVRVDGALELRAPGGARTSLIVDTLFSTPTSRVAIAAADPSAGTVDLELRPFDIEAFEAEGAPGWPPAAVRLYSDGATVTDTGAGTRKEADHVVVDDGPGVLGRYGWDPEQLSLGLITHGAGRIEGQPKQGRAVIRRTARAGDTTIVLRAEPAGWAVGDRIVVTGTHYVGRDLTTGAYLGSEDEVRGIASVRGVEIGLDRALEHDHDTPREDLHAYAANLTRNVRVFSSAGLGLERLDARAVGASSSRLGHVMFMHNEDVLVRHAAFEDLGRSNKNDCLDDFMRFGYEGLNAGRLMEQTEDGRVARKTKVEEVTNPRGRYSVHLHRTGATGADEIAEIEGCVVTGGPGWGFVSHDSRADFRGNVTFGVLGAGFVAETGNETGTWEGNIAINTYGADFNSRVLGPKELYRYENDNFDNTILLEKRGSWKNQDFGHFGDGFWFQGKQVDVVDNVSVSSGLEGYFFMFRAPDQINVDRTLLIEPLAVHSPNGMHPFGPGLNVFTGNESIADRGGLAMIGLAGSRTNDSRSVIRDFTAWEVGQVGTHSQYYPAYNIMESTFIASTSADANPTDGIQFEKVMLDVVLADLTIEGFPHMYDLRKSWSPGAKNQHGFDDPYDVMREAEERGLPNPLPLGHAHVLVDCGFTATEARQNHLMGSTWREEDTILTSEQLVPGRFSIELDDESLRVDLDNKSITYGWLPDDPIRPTLVEGHVLLLRGTKTDSIGEIPIAYHNNLLVWHEDAVQHRLESEGYYRMAGGRVGVLLEEVFADRYSAARHVVRFMAELDPRWDLSGLADRGEYQAREHPDVYVPAFLLNG